MLTIQSTIQIRTLNSPLSSAPGLLLLLQGCVLSITDFNNNDCHFAPPPPPPPVSYRYVNVGVVIQLYTLLKDVCKHYPTITQRVRCFSNLWLPNLTLSWASVYKHLLAWTSLATQDCTAVIYTLMSPITNNCDAGMYTRISLHESMNSILVIYN